MSSTELGRFLRQTRERIDDPLTGRPYTQDALARAVGTSREALSAWERGQNDLNDPAVVNRLARTLGVPVESFVRALGYEVGAPELDSDETEAVRIVRRVPQPYRPGLLALMRGTARELAGLPEPEQPERRAAG